MSLSEMPCNYPRRLYSRRRG